MADNRDLKHGEKRMALFTSEKGRDRANAHRAIEGLNQNDQLIALLHEQNGMLNEVCEHLRYISARLYSIETKGQTGPAV